MQLQIGMPVIVNEFDRPYGEGVAIVESIDEKNGLATAIYLSSQRSGLICKGPIEDMTSVNDFGVVVIPAIGQYHVLKSTQMPKAKYRNGEPRRWQGSVGMDRYAANERALMLYIDYLDRLKGTLNV